MANRSTSSDRITSARMAKWSALMCVVAMCLAANGSISNASEAPVNDLPRLNTSAEVVFKSGNCESCHMFDATFTHPMMQVTAGRTPAAFPLEHGKMTCLTCHDDRAARAHGSESPDGRAFLRGGLQGAAFCQQCHQTGNGSRSSMHASMTLQAHQKTKQPRIPAPQLQSQSPADGKIDLESTQCISCHDGLMGPDVDFGMMAAAKLRMERGRPQSHPVGVQYAANNSGDVALRAMAYLDRRIRFFDGRVGCGSCHSVYSTESKLLVMSNTGSALCMTCHAE